LMAGLAYDAHTKDIRPDDGTKKNKGMQTISTYWLDILEYSTYKANNQFYLAAKYGGFKVPDGYSTYGQTDPLPDKWWWTTTELTVGGQKRPDNYYVASQPDQMVTGLQRAFSSIAAQLKSFSTSFSTSAPQIAASGTNSYSAQYDSTTWSGEVAANTTTFGSDSTPQFVEAWKFSDKLAAQIASTDGLGWKNKRRIATFNNTTKKGVPFKLELLDSTQQGQLDTLYRTGNDSADYLNYLRGDATHEASSSAAGSAKIYRDRAKPLGDIVGSKLRVVGPPSAPFSSATNSGYDAYKTAQKDRQTMLYVGSNDGMLHAINGSTKTGDDAAGTEVFAYVPGSLYAGPSSSPTVNGLQTRGDPDFTHRYFVDGNPATFDIDFGNTAGGSGTSDWRTILVGGLGKGGKSYYAIDISNPAAMDSETVVADKVLWEFSNTTPDVDGKLGFTFGEPIAVKTKKYKWVLVFGSGYNNSDGKGYIFIVNPRTGALLETIATGAGTTTEEAGLAHVQAYVPERTDNTAETLYAGDLLGNLWRVDVTGEPTSYPAAVQFAKLTNGDNQAVPVTSRPLAVIQPYTNTRWVVVGTGRLLSETDKFSNQSQAFFAFRDGTNLRPNSDTQLPATMSFPLKRTNLRTLTDLKTPVVLNLATEIGWWVDLGATAGLGWRVISDPSSFYGEVSFSTMVPTIADECSPAGIGRIYTIDLGTGKTKLLNDSGAAITYAEGFDGAVTDLRNLSVGGKRVLVYGTDQGKKGKIKLEPPTPIPAKRLNWRELLLAD
jgi:type IV pilus assembly protein PilY1